MKEKLVAIWHFAIGLLLYPAAFVLLVWLWWTDGHWGWGLLVLGSVIILDDGHWGWGLLVLGSVIILDQTWLSLISRLFGRRKNN